jgi:hypothetical protein
VALVGKQYQRNKEKTLSNSKERTVGGIATNYAVKEIPDTINYGR